MSKMRKLHFSEVGRGRLGKEVQEAFEQAAITARDLNGKTTVVLRINVFPPDPNDPMVGGADFSLSVVEPPKKSIRFTTLLQDGVIIKDGDSEGDVLQYDLGLELPSNVTQMRNKGAIDG